MGSAFTKVAPTKKKNDEEVLTMSATATPNKFLDPRSPNPFRTPITDLPYNDAKPVSKMQDLTSDDNISTSTSITPTKLKNKLLRDLGYNTLDPRSPALNFDRTPINFNDSNISDDFSLAELSLTESDIQTPAKEKQFETFNTPVLENVKLAELKIDPRSPSIDIERTPLDLNVLLEKTPEEDSILESDAEEEAKTSTKEKVETIAEIVKNIIFMDEDHEQPITPKAAKTENIAMVGKVRTPLSCLVNTQGSENRIDKRTRMQNNTSLARKIFKESTASANHNTSKLNNSSSKIPVLRKSLLKEN